MQFAALSVFCLLLCSQTLAVRDLEGIASRFLLQGRPSARVSVTSTTRGSVRVRARARSFSVTEARNQFQSTITSVTLEAAEGVETEFMVDQAVQAFGEAIASAFVEASVSIVSTSPGAMTCARAVVNAEASAEATARALIEVLAEVSSPQLFVSASDAVEAIESVMVSAFASANVNACVNGVGQVEAMASQLARVVGTASAQVTAAVVASFSPDALVAGIDVTATGDQVIVTTIQGTSIVQTSGDVEANANTSFIAGGKR